MADKKIKAENGGKIILGDNLLIVDENTGVSTFSSAPSFPDNGLVVTDQAQAFDGNKTFNNDVIILGDLTVSGTTTTIDTTVVQSDQLLITNIGPDTGAVINQASGGGGPLDVQVAGVSKLYVDSAGNVGIGTASPGYLLDVGGINPGDGIGFSVAGFSALQRGVFSDATTTTPYTELVLGVSSARGHAKGGAIISGREGIYSITSSTQDSYLAFETTLDGVRAEKMRISSAGAVTLGPSGFTGAHTVHGFIGLTRTENISSNGNSDSNWFLIRKVSFFSTTNFSSTGALIDVLQFGATNGEGASCRIHTTTKRQSTTNFGRVAVVSSHNMANLVAYRLDATGGDLGGGAFYVWVKRHLGYSFINVFINESGEHSHAQNLMTDTGSSDTPAGATVI